MQFSAKKKNTGRKFLASTKEESANWKVSAGTHRVGRNSSFQLASCKEILQLFQESEEDFLGRISKGDKVWLCHYDPESLQQSRRRKHADSPRSFKSPIEPQVGNVLATTFWDIEGILLNDYTQQNATITVQYYPNLLRQLRDAIKEKCRGNIIRGILLLHNNAPVHKCKL